MLDREYALLVGSYSDMDALAHQPYAPVPGKGIYAMTLDRAGRLTLTDVVEALNPAVLIPHSNGRTMYAIVETIRDRGDVLRYDVTDGGSLDYKDSFRASGRSTCYLALSPRKDAAIIINYWDAIIDVVDVDADGKLGSLRQSFKQVHRPDGTWRQVQNREDHWGNRQVGPHAHCAHFWHDWVFIPDLGENAVFQYRYDADAKRLARECHIDFEPGSGPRHMAMHPGLDVCYVSNELFNTVCVARLDASDPAAVKPRLIPFQYESTVDNRESVSYVSEIKLSPDARFLSVSNRGDNSLAIFRVLDDGRLDRTGLVPTGGKFPRHFAITPCGKAVIVANQDSGHVRVFARDVATGALEMTGEIQEIPAPNYVRFP
ncbi:lactonase family protein [Roseospira visakhapatnamensis]|uniref:6-phosphogluconolactonase n=1 Tax=Roseospira visakhapatnamensis TaxID=390880 RepID=A0A7W6RA38_9PROT|nr:lactonase family protein [Roseospira visakhapatnamensis]MBB4264682.1 6-phosphogluconolactonase [Roseospira visakhapatnamensis]